MTGLSNDAAEREDAGTPTMLGDIRAARAFSAEHADGLKPIAARQTRLDAHAPVGSAEVPGLELAGTGVRTRPPIFFLIRDG